MHSKERDRKPDHEAFWAAARNDRRVLRALVACSEEPTVRRFVERTYRSLRLPKRDVYKALGRLIDSGLVAPKCIDMLNASSDTTFLAVLPRTRRAALDSNRDR